MEKKYQIFISSTYEDLKEERSKVVATILKSNHFPIGMEMFSADNKEQWSIIQETIDSSDYYILIIKKRYGSLMTKEKISYTEKEYDYALSVNIPILAFIISNDAPIKIQDIESDPDKIKKLNNFEEKVKKNGECDFWLNADHLCTQVSQALNKQFLRNLRSGWVKTDKIDESMNFSNTNFEELRKMSNRILNEFVDRENNIMFAHEFIDVMNDRSLKIIQGQTYIDQFNRFVVIDFHNDDQQKIEVTVTTTIKYHHVKKGTKYYAASPRFNTEEEAISYRHIAFWVNGRDAISNIISDRILLTGQRWPHLVKNNYDLPEDDSPEIVHKTQHISPIRNFYQLNQLLFPCRNYTLQIMLKHDVNEKYNLAVGSFNYFNVPSYPDYKTTDRKDALYFIESPGWMLPGSGYSFTLHEI